MGHSEMRRRETRCAVPLGRPLGVSQRDTRPAEVADTIRAYPCPDGFSPSRWGRLQDGAARFAQEWGARAVALGWTESELFAFAEPFARVDLQGAAWFIGGSTVVAVTEDAITLRTESGATQRAYRRAEPCATFSNSRGPRDNAF